MVHSIQKESEFIELVSESKGYVLVDYYAQWCGPCRVFSPILEKLSKEFTNVRFYKVDIEVPDLKNVVEEEKIECMPTFVLYKDGVELDQNGKSYRFSGAKEDSARKLLSKSSEE
jgi:thioredoxin 1